jgi:hypothetical protein
MRSSTCRSKVESRGPASWWASSGTRSTSCLNKFRGCGRIGTLFIFSSGSMKRSGTLSRRFLSRSRVIVPAELALMAHRIREEPWPTAFADEVDHQVIPDLAGTLDNVRRSQQSWFRSGKGKLALSAAGLTAATAGTVVSLVAAPVVGPAAVAAGALGLVSGFGRAGLVHPMSYPVYECASPRTTTARSICAAVLMRSTSPVATSCPQGFLLSTMRGVLRA